jgi:hypothetical protein
VLLQCANPGGVADIPSRLGPPHILNNGAQAISFMATELSFALHFLANTPTLKPAQVLKDYIALALSLRQCRQQLLIARELLRVAEVKLRIIALHNGMIALLRERVQPNQTRA